MYTVRNLDAGDDVQGVRNDVMEISKRGLCYLVSMKFRTGRSDEQG